MAYDPPPVASVPHALPQNNYMQQLKISTPMYIMYLRTYVLMRAMSSRQIVKTEFPPKGTVPKIQTKIPTILCR
jgi:hypothetical protein